jgi:glycerate kinase
MKILAAFDKFKDSMTAATACEAAILGAREALGSSVSITQAPLTDGGEGFCSILTHAANGYVESHTVCGPLGADLEAPLGWVEGKALPKAVRPFFNPGNGKVAIIEMAATAGLEQVPAERRHPKYCTTYGVGELIRIAVAEGADAILLGIGGSATSDLGLGVLEALGLRFVDSENNAIERILPTRWAQVAQLAGEIEVPVPPIYIACDVDNPLLGPLGAAIVYGPQKGLPADEVDAFDTEAAGLATKLCQYFNKPESLRDVPGSGAAGGIGFGLKVACNAEFVAGFELVNAWLELDSKIAAADLILTGEGKTDSSSLSGKGPVALVSAAQKSDKRSLLLAGCVEAAAAAHLQTHFPKCAVYEITPEGCPLPKALADGPENLKAKTASVIRQHLAL